MRSLIMTPRISTKPTARSEHAGRLARTFRIVIGLVYLFGAPTHVYFALMDPAGYRGMSEWAPPVTAVSRVLWEDWFLPNAHYLGLLIAAGELGIALLILSRGRAARLGFVGATAFHLSLAALFGMWPYTVPMAIVLGHMTTLEFTDGPALRLLRRVRRTDPTDGRPSTTSPYGTARSAA